MQKKMKIIRFDRARISSFFKNSLISISISIGMIFSLEILYRFLKANNYTFASTHRENLKFQKIAFDNKYTYKELSELNNSFGVYNGLVYKPWIQIGNAPHKNKFSIVSDGVRKTFNPDSKCKEPNVFWFFGGSTTYGTGVSWRETIPSKFSILLKENSICAKVINFGVPYHYSLQESFFMAIELAKSEFPKPDFVFFVDGLNDFNQLGSSIKKEPFYTPMLSKLIGTDSVGVNEKLNNQIFTINLAIVDYLKFKMGLDRSITNYQKPKNLNDIEILEKLTKNIAESNKFRSNICKIYKIKCYQFLQPVPYLHYEKKYNETLTIDYDQNKSNFFFEGYKKIVEDNTLNSQSGLKVNDASKIFLSYKDGIPYVDAFHYSPRANKYFAEHIYKTIYN